MTDMKRRNGEEVVGEMDTGPIEHIIVAMFRRLGPGASVFFIICAREPNNAHTIIGNERTLRGVDGENQVFATWHGPVDDAGGGSVSQFLGAGTTHKDQFTQWRRHDVMRRGANPTKLIVTIPKSISIVHVGHAQPSNVRQMLYLPNIGGKDCSRFDVKFDVRPGVDAPCIKKVRAWKAWLDVLAKKEFGECLWGYELAETYVDQDFRAFRGNHMHRDVELRRQAFGGGHTYV
ncbi:hypothetical protein BU15DRAFT_63085 [Melanogaster broomeanus]|nr:hypothetical protein BU15DRAFT_63085 [Melanogaster broomeanus]